MFTFLIPAGFARPIDSVLLVDIAQSGKRLIAVGENGVIFISDDGASSWQEVKSPVDQLLTSVSFSNDKTVWATGHGGVILKSEDKGNTWRIVRQQIQDDTPIFDLIFLDDKTGFAVGAYGLLLKTIDAGQSWQKVKTDYDWHLYSLARLNSTQAAVVGENHVIALLNKNSDLVDLSETIKSGSLFDVAAIDQHRILVAGLGGFAYLISLQGKILKTLPLPDADAIQSILLLDDTRVVLAGAGGSLFLGNIKTKDVTKISSGISGSINKLFKVSGSVIALTSRGIHRFERGTFQ